MGRPNSKPGLLAAAALIWAAGGTACATRYEPVNAFRDYARDESRRAAIPPPVILLLVDGLGSSLLRSGLASGNLPRIQQFFLGGSQSFNLGRATFPSLTYPNIASILTTSNIQTHHIIGNRVLYGDQPTNFESLGSREALNWRMGKETVFSRLHSQNRSSMSLAHFFYFGATVRQADDLKSAVAYAASNYDYVDGKALGSLEALLESTTPESPLPAFTFVHLIGVDAISHQFGPASREARDYLASVDRELGRLCDRVLTLESEGIRPIILLTADHGFTTVRRFADLEGWIGKEAPGTTVLNEGRFLGLRFPSHLDESQRSALLARASTASRNVAWTLQRAGNRVWIRGPGIQASFEYSEGACDSSTSPVHPIRWQGGNALCPADLDRVAMSPFPPYFFSNVATYFESRYHPDALILAADHVLFSRGYKGAHGGLTLEELLVPVLARNADLHPTRGPIRTFELLRFMTASAPPVFAAHVQEAPPSTSDPIPLDETTPQSFSISTPLDRNFITSVSRSGARRLSLDSRISPSLSLQYRQAWTTLFSTDFGYRFEYTSYDSGNTLHQDSHSLHRLTASGSFRFGEHQKLILGVGESQDFFLHDPLSGDSELTRAWIPEVSFGSKSRLYSTGMGDLFLGGSLAILLPAEIENGPHVYTGFSQELSLSFENPIGASDTLSFSGSLRHANQNSTVENRAATRTQLGASYTLSLPR